MFRKTTWRVRVFQLFLVEDGKKFVCYLFCASLVLKKIADEGK